MLRPKSPINFLLLFLAAALVAAYFIIKPFLGPLILAAVLAFIFQPVYLKWLKIIRDKKSSAALLTVIVAVILVLLPIVFLGSQIVKEASQLYNSLAIENKKDLIAVVEKVVDKLRPLNLVPENFSLDIDKYLREGALLLVKSVGGIFSSFAKMILNFFIFFMAFYYLLKDGYKVKDYFVALSPLEDKDDKLIVRRLRSAVSSVVKGNLLVGIIQGILTGIGFALFDVPNPVLWGSVAAIAALIPSIGTALVLVPAIMFLFITGNNFNAVGLLIWGVVAVGLIDNFLGPKLMGSGMKLNPLIVFLSVMGGVAFFGPLGILLGPLSVSIFLALIEIYFSLKKSVL